MNSEKTGQNELLVSNRNIRFIADYCRDHAIPESAFLSGLGYPESYLKDPDQWVSLPTFATITRRVRKAFNDDPSVFYDIGVAATEAGGLGILESLKRVVFRVIDDPGLFIARVPTYMSFFNKTKSIRVLGRGTGTATLQIKFREDIEPIYDFNSGPLVMGVLASIPKIWNLPLGKVEEKLLQYDVVQLLRDEFSILSEIKDGKLYVEGEEYGKEVELLPEKIESGSYFLGKYRKLRPKAKVKGIFISKEYRYKNYRLLVPGQIYNAPYFILKTEWEHASLIKRMAALAVSFMPERSGQLREIEEKAVYFQKYARELEDKIIDRNRLILEEKEKVEELKNRVSRILGSQLPPDLVNLMVEGKLAPRKNKGIVLFADLVGFSTQVTKAKDFSLFFERLNRYFEVANNTIRSRGGWVYKYLGDGIMAVFGGYQDNEDYETLGIQAIKAAEKMHTLVREAGWDIRIGLEYGEFLSGEIGPKGERIWDFLGPTVNFACRLEQNASTNEILIGPNLMKIIGDKIKTEKRHIVLKGIGKKSVYSLQNIA
ncbi:MAG: adenylate/guanylate cyclase domain-containing protein [Patescibacteria group bacterium]